MRAAVSGRARSPPGPPGPKAGPVRTGEISLGLGGARDGGTLYVPSSYRPDRPAPLFVMFQGAGGRADHALALVKELADETGALVLATQSRGSTWDVIADELGPDVARLDEALARTFASYAVDPAHVAVGGFSDGASYALTVGLANGDLFGGVVAFSPGFFVAVPHDRDVPKPRVFVSHGVGDTVLPIERCSRRIVPRLLRAGYDVTYREFDGPHTVPADIARAAVAWFLGRRVG